VTRLPWLSPGAGSLLALARSPTPEVWSQIRADPGAVLLVVRLTPALRGLSAVSFYPAVLDNPAIFDEALRRLSEPGPGWVDWSQPALQPIYQSALCYAQAAHILAEHTGQCDPENAWVAGLLAPLGWFGVCAVEPDRATNCLSDPDLARHPSAVQRRHWGVDASGLGRRLARRWGLPDWLAAIVAHLSLPAEIAERFGADADLFQVVQQAVALVEQKGIANCKLQIANCKLEDESLPDVAPILTRDADQFAIGNWQLAIGNAPYSAWQRPDQVPLLNDLLRLAAENLRLRGAPLLTWLETDLDELHAALEEERLAQSERLQEQKLAALAEFAAGAGHEINNPLAVISGQAQYLLRQLDEGVRGKAEGVTENGDMPSTPSPSHPLTPSSSRRGLQVIIEQAQRIHHVLRDLMQFARPPQPHKESVDLAVLVREAVTAVHELAEQRRVRLIGPEAEAPLTVLADCVQVRTALTCLLRNAVEAAPAGPEADGWASIRLDKSCEDRVEVVVEDNGPGPAGPQHDHLFDPFFSGRTAGRGRGLGLPTAWRLAQQHGGDVRFSRPTGGPTRFVLTLPRQLESSANSGIHQELGKSA
jgi:signal transduction histidine kinase